MTPVHRRVTYKLYPSVIQAATMGRVCELHRVLYNAALQERIDAWRRSKIAISFAAQCRSLTQIRREDPDYFGLNAQSLQVTLKRLDLAFWHFYRRGKLGATPGFPRFKGRERFFGFGFKTHGDGFRFEPGTNWWHGQLRLSGIGTMRARGKARTPGRIVCCDIQRKTDGWYLSLVVLCQPHRARTGDGVVGLHWGVEAFATLCHGPGQFEEIPNDRLLVQEQDAIKQAQRDLYRHLQGRRSRRAAKARRQLARRSRRLANRRKNHNHNTTARLVRDYAVIVTEGLSAKNMTASAVGMPQEPGKNIRERAGLNLAILDMAPGGFLSHLICKAEEAGGQVILVDPRKHRASQTDPVDGSVQKKVLPERTRILQDRQRIGRDQAAARMLWNIGQHILGGERARTRSSETLTKAV
jgi:putative transposase